MNAKKGLILGAVAGLGASIGSITTALIMTKECHNMMEINKAESKKIKDDMDKINADIHRAENAFNTYKEKIELYDKETKELYNATLQGFKGLAEQGKIHQSNLKKVSDASIELIKKELKIILNEAKVEIDDKKKETVNEMSDTLEQLKFMIGNFNEIMKNDKEDITIIEKMIKQVDTDTGKKGSSKKGKNK